MTVTLDEDDREAQSVLRMEGPFVLPGHEACADALLAGVLQTLSEQTRLWRYSPPLPPEPGRYDASSITV